MFLCYKSAANINHAHRGAFAKMRPLNTHRHTLSITNQSFAVQLPSSFTARLGENGLMQDTVGAIGIAQYFLVNLPGLDLDHAMW